MTTQLFDLTGQVALVTGASRGIGEAVAMLLAEQGAHVIVASRKLDACQRVVDNILKNGGSAQAIACHIGEMDQITAIFSQIESEHGSLDILVNNAAANPYFGHVLDTDLSAFEKTVDVNIRGYFFMSVRAANLMKKNGGAIINVASVNGVIPGDFQGIYSITKAAVISMTKTFAKECAPFNIRVNAILPGGTDTKFASALTKNEKLLNSILPMIPMARMAQPEEIAPAFLFLASDEASYITGVSLPVDGGLLC